MSAEADPFANLRDLIPDGAMPTYGVRIVEFFDDDGHAHYEYAIDGEARTVAVLGLLTGLQHLLMTPRDVQP